MKFLNLNSDKTTIFELKKRLARYLKIQKQFVIWEIGSRDGLDSVQLSKTFEGSLVYAFEPNPMTFPKLEAIASKVSRISASNMALLDIDEEIDFYQIDTELTQSSWPDGNPGASSIYIANGFYPYEKYVQKKIQVQSHRADTLINQNDYPVPNLIWMDVQGSEVLVLKGFGEHLKLVDAVYVELSLQEIYLKQSLAGDVVDILDPHFLWHSNLTKGDWQFDALFINKRYKAPSLSLRNFFLRYSLKSKLLIGIKPNTAKIIVSHVSKYILKAVLLFLKKNESARIGAYLFKRSQSFLLRDNHSELKGSIRRVISSSQPTRPLKGRDGGALEIVIPCHKKDLEVLDFTLKCAVENVQNPISNIIIVSTSEVYDELSLRYPNFTIRNESDLIDVQIEKLIEMLVPYERQSWVRQQFIKIGAVLKSSVGASLIIDADTLLLSKRTWIDKNQQQLLCIADEYHLPYKMHVQKFLGVQIHGLSFVTHHQLMQKDFVEKIYGVNGIRLEDWLSLGDFTQISPFSEYDTYGEWLLNFESNKTKLAKWNNRSVRFESIKNMSLLDINRKYSQYSSISIHSYL